jgi:predicted esterase YcpF (UPF0227 family)
MLDKKLKIIYIHGLDSEPKPAKIDALREISQEVSALHIDYRENPDAFWVLQSYIQREGIEFLVGSSYGGMLAYYLAAELKLPALLFNPALHSMSLQPELPKNISTHEKPLYVVLGANDQTIRPNFTLEFFRKNKIKNARIVTCHHLAHKIDVQTFKEMSRWALFSFLKP